MKRHTGSAGRTGRAAGVALRRPELVYSFHRGASSSAGDGPDARHRADDPPSRSPDARWKLSDTLIMIVAALRVLLPYVLVVLATVGAAWGFWLLLFG